VEIQYATGQIPRLDWRRGFPGRQTIPLGRRPITDATSSSKRANTAGISSSL